MKPTDSLPLEEYAEFAAEAARRAGEIVLRFFEIIRKNQGGPFLRQGGHAQRAGPPLQDEGGYPPEGRRAGAGPPLQVEYKADHSPVTTADRESERLLRKLLEERYPEHGILGEEYGLTRGEAPLRWYLDPIDGTYSFVRGVPLFGVMVGLAVRDNAPQKQVSRPPERPKDDTAEGSFDALVGVVHLPALGETVVAWRGGGCWWSRGVGSVRAQASPAATPGAASSAPTKAGFGVRAQVSATARLEDALLLSTDPLDLVRSPKQQAYERLRARVRLQRGWGDCYGHVLVATGRADIMLDAALHDWDAAPLIPILEEAGGRFTDWRGRRTISGGDGFATNGALYEQVLQIIREKK